VLHQLQSFASPSKTMDKRYLRSIRLLSECMQLFEKSSAKRVKALGFTESQFDIIATLGNTPGMTCKELGEKTLITKGTLTGVLDRLESKGLIQRERGEDRRQLFIKLTAEGELQFARSFPEIVNQGRTMFSTYQSSDFDALEAQLLKLKETLGQ
jgi:MarR family 2-MHQ and catechol resistance regulon transcriptional repressor